MRRTSISKVDRVQKPGQNNGSGKSFDSSQLQNGQGSSDPGKSGAGDPSDEKKKGPGRRVLSDTDRLPKEFIEKIKEALSKSDWDIGALPDPGSTEGSGETPGEEGAISNGQIAPGQDAYDERIWNKTPDELESNMDDAIRQGLENEKVADAKAEKEGNTQSEKTMGGKGKGRGTIRDRLEVENLSKTNWAAIFKSRLSAYSNEKTKTKAWNRRFVAGRRMATSKLPSKTKEMDTLPELNLILDTSSSIGKSELQLILSEVNVALQAAKIKNLNLVMWHNQPYYHKKYKDITSKNFIQVIDDVRNNWEGGGNDDVALYQKIIDLGIAKNFTISITDGYIDDITRPGTKVNELATKALDPQQTIFGIIFPNKSMPYSTWTNISSRFIGTKLPIFLESSKFQ
jgi:hypothetical protein